MNSFLLFTNRTKVGGAVEGHREVELVVEVDSLLDPYAADRGPTGTGLGRDEGIGEDSLGGLDGLVYNIGIGGGGDGPAGKVSDDAWDRIMLVNLTAARRTMGALIPLLRDSGHGAIVAISSLASIAPSPMISYSVSKAGMNRLV